MTIVNNRYCYGIHNSFLLTLFPIPLRSEMRTTFVKVENRDVMIGVRFKQAGGQKKIQNKQNTSSEIGNIEWAHEQMYRHIFLCVDAVFGKHFGIFFYSLITFKSAPELRSLVRLFFFALSFLIPFLIFRVACCTCKLQNVRDDRPIRRK